MSIPESRPSITPQFNLAVFALGAAVGISHFLLTSPTVAGASPVVLVLSIGLDAVRAIVMLFVVALVIRAFWNRLIADLFSLRDINYQEAIAMILVPSVLLIG